MAQQRRNRCGKAEGLVALCNTRLEDLLVHVTERDELHVGEATQLVGVAVTAPIEADDGDADLVCRAARRGHRDGLTRGELGGEAACGGTLEEVTTTEFSHGSGLIGICGGSRRRA